MLITNCRVQITDCHRRNAYKETKTKDANKRYFLLLPKIETS